MRGTRCVRRKCSISAEWTRSPAIEPHDGCVRAVGCWSRFPKPSCPAPWESAVRTSGSPPNWSACRSKSWPRERLREGTSGGIGAIPAPGVPRGAARAIPVLLGGGPVMGRRPGGVRTGGGEVPRGTMGRGTTGRVPRGTIGRVPRGTIGRGRCQQPVAKPTRRSPGDASRLNRASPRRSSLRFGRNTLGIPPSRALSAGRLARLGAHVGFTTGCQNPRRGRGALTDAVHRQGQRPRQRGRDGAR